MLDKKVPDLKQNSSSYWRDNLKLLYPLLAIWLIVPFGLGIVFSDALDQWRIGGFKLGFWFAQQGSIYVFLVLIAIYVYAMERIDRKWRRSRDNTDPDAEDTSSDIDQTQVP